MSQDLSQSNEHRQGIKVISYSHSEHSISEHTIFFNLLFIFTTKVGSGGGVAMILLLLLLLLLLKTIILEQL